MEAIHLFKTKISSAKIKWENDTVRIRKWENNVIKVHGRSKIISKNRVYKTITKRTTIKCDVEEQMPATTYPTIPLVTLLRKNQWNYRDAEVKTEI